MKRLPNRQNGQALVEFAVLGIAGFTIWFSMFFFAEKLLKRTLTEGTSVFAARKALSREPIVNPPGVRTHVKASRTSATASSQIETTLSTHSLELPKRDNAVHLQSRLPSFGALLRSFSE